MDFAVPAFIFFTKEIGQDIPKHISIVASKNSGINTTNLSFFVLMYYTFDGNISLIYNNNKIYNVKVINGALLIWNLPRSDIF